MTVYFDILHLTEDTVSQYLQLDVTGIRKINAHNNDPAFLSDIIRLSLLKKYGGVYIDASTLCFEKWSDWFVDLVKDVPRWRRYMIAIFNPMFQMRPRVTVIENSLLYSPPDHPIISEWLSQMFQPRRNFSHSFPGRLSRTYHYAYLISSSILTRTPISVQTDIIVLNDALINVLSYMRSRGGNGKRDLRYSKRGECTMAPL